MAEKKQKTESEIKKDAQIGVRIDSDIASKLEDEAIEIRKKTGYNVTKSDIIRRIIIEYFSNKSK